MSRPSLVPVPRQGRGTDSRAGARCSTQAERKPFMLSVIVTGGLATVGLWLVNNPGDLLTLANRMTAAARISGLLGTSLVLVQIVLIARMLWLARWIGTDRMTAWHRFNGQYTIGMLVVASNR